MHVLTILANRWFVLNDMNCEKVVFILDMVCKIKEFHTRAEKRQIQMANAQWVREMRKLTQKRAGEEKVEWVKEGQAVKDESQKEKQPR